MCKLAKTSSITLKEKYRKLRNKGNNLKRQGRAKFFFNNLESSIRVLIHICTKGGGWHCETGLCPLVKSLLTVPRRYFFCGSFILILSCVCYDFVRVCLLMPCGHLLGKD